MRPICQIYHHAASDFNPRAASPLEFLAKCLSSRPSHRTPNFQFFHSRLQGRGRETQCNGGPIFATHFPTQPFQGCDNVLPLHFRELAQLLLQLLLRVRRLNHVAKLAHIPRPRIAFDLVDTLARNTFVGLPIFSEKSSTNLQARIGASPSRLRSGGNSRGNTLRRQNRSPRTPPTAGCSWSRQSRAH